MICFFIELMNFKKLFDKFSIYMWIYLNLSVYLEKIFLKLIDVRIFIIVCNKYKNFINNFF